MATVGALGEEVQHGPGRGRHWQPVDNADITWREVSDVEADQWVMAPAAARDGELCEIGQLLPQLLDVSGARV